MQTHRDVLRLHREAAAKKAPLFVQRSQMLRNIDMFWAHALCNSDVAQYISEYDRELLQHLDSVRSPLARPAHHACKSATLQFAIS